MKILLIGKNGQLGSQIDEIARKRGHAISSFGKKELNILKKRQLKKTLDKVNPEIVINTAAYHVVPDCEKYPDKAFQINAVAQKNLADICHTKKIRLVYYSTDKVFDGNKRRPYKESDVTNPIQIYGLSKLAGELITLNYNSDSIVIRTCGIFGGLTGSREKKGNFVLYILQQAKQSTELTISSEQVASFVNAYDLATATLDLLEKNVKSGIYNVVNEGYDSWANFAKEIIKIKKLSLIIKPVNRKGMHGDTRNPIFTPLDTSKIKSYKILLPTWQNALKRYLSFLERNGI